MEKKEYRNRLFGRTRGRSKKKINIKNYLKDLNKYKIKEFELSKNYILDIGTGYGETSVFLSKKFRSQTIIACEKYIDGNLNLIKNIVLNKIENIRVHPGNVYDILDNYKIDKYFSLVSIFFPDPWPKKRHFKRRLLTEEFILKIYKFLKAKGEIHIVTDSTSYKRYILNTIYNTKNLFEWKNQNSIHLDLKDYYDLETKYYKKAINSYRKPSIFILKKI